MGIDPRHAAQSRIDGDAVRSARGQPARRDRSHGHGRRRARTGGAIVVAADGSGRDFDRGTMRSRSSLGDSDLRRALREDLRRAPDIARALARISVGRGGPRDLGALRDGMKGRARLARKLAFSTIR
jgi:hypothetical protein